jgi:putative membrane protein
MAFGFVIERFGLFVSILAPQHNMTMQRGISFWTGLVFVLLGVFVAIFSTLQYKKVVSTLKPIEIPEGYRTDPGVFTNLVVAALGVVLIIYFFHGI